MLTVYQGNRLEALADHLIELLAKPLSDPLLREVIVTQHQGMARWLSQRIAHAYGVAANIDFPFPSAFVWRLFHTLLPEVPERPGFDRDTLVWRVYGLIPACLDKPGFEPLQQYLAGDVDGLKGYQLSRQIADVYDQYLIYRPQWLLDWERGEDSHWQAQLWRELVGMPGEAPHRAALLQRFIALAKAGGWRRDRLPERVFVFGIGALPPAYLEVLTRLGEVIDVHLFVVNPSLAFWEDIVDPRSLAKLRARWRRLGQPDVSEYYPQGNTLLASMGRQGRDFYQQLSQYSPQVEDLFSWPSGGTLLAALQGDMLELIERGSEGEPEQVIAATDCSIQLHSAHSPMREVQVLHDQLLALFERHPALRPQDIVVMTPAIDRYAPYIEAVFGSAPASRYIPWTVVDRSAQAEHPILTSVMQLLGLPQSRFAVSEVLALLEVPAVMRALGLDLSALDRIRQWVTESGVRWGLDANDRSALGLPATDDHSWHFGLQRLMLGYAMPVGSGLYHGIHPYPAIEGGEARWLGVLQRFIGRLRGLRQQLKGRYPMAQWQAMVNELLTLFEVEQEDEQAALQLIRDAMQAMVDNAGLAGFHGELPLQVVQDYLKGHLNTGGGGQRFLTGQVNFCAMMPMRSIPFRVVCLLGMNDGDYPRSRHAISFDLMAGDHKPGDRSRRDEDRYLFLEALLSAREYLYISYVGRSIRDNTVRLPSVLVTELFDYIEQGYRLAEGDLRSHLFTEHPLQPFSRHYFRADSQLFSYADEWLAGSRMLDQPRQASGRFVDAPMPSAPAQQEVTVGLDELVHFFRNPARAFLRQRLGLLLEQQGDWIEDVEPFDLDALAATQLKSQLLTWRLAGRHEDELALLRAHGVLPYGGFGDRVYQQAVDAVNKVHALAAPLLTTVREPVSVDLVVAGIRLRGVLEQLTPSGRVQARCARMTGNDAIAAWIGHLVLHCLPGESGKPVSHHVAEDKHLVLQPPADPLQHLSTLLGLYQQGMAEPLPFYPKSSFDFADKLNAGKADGEAIEAARRRWEGGIGRDGRALPGECEDAYIRLAMRGREPFDQAFVETSRSVFLPMFAHAQMTKVDA